MTTKDIFNQMQGRIDANPAKLAGIQAVFQFDIGGTDPGIFYVVIDGGKGVVNEGSYDSPDITLTMSSNDFADLVQGRLDGTMAFMQGKLQVKGDMMLAMRLQSLL